MLKATNYCTTLGAHLKGTTQYVSPIFASKDKKYSCPQCKEDIIFKKGKIKRPHFSHLPGSKCGYYDNPSEGAIHKEAKHLLAKLLKLQKNIFIKKKCAGILCPLEDRYCEPIKITINKFYKNTNISNDDKYFNHNGKKNKT